MCNIYEGNALQPIRYHHYDDYYYYSCVCVYQTDSKKDRSIKSLLFNSK